MFLKAAGSIGSSGVTTSKETVASARGVPATSFCHIKNFTTRLKKEWKVCLELVPQITTKQRFLKDWLAYDLTVRSPGNREMPFSALRRFPNIFPSLSFQISRNPHL
jgi:hypothetical protein